MSYQLSRYITRHSFKRPNIPKFQNKKCLAPPANFSCMMNKSTDRESPRAMIRDFRRWISITRIPYHNSRFLLTSGTIAHPSKSNVTGSIEKLGDCDEIFLVQKASRKEEDELNIKMEYKYEVNDKMGDNLFHAVQIYESYPPRFDLKLYGSDGQILVTHKLLQGLSSKLLNMQIICPGGLYLGSIEEKIDFESNSHPIFELRNSRDELKAVVLTDFAHNGILRRSIKILAADRKTTIGKISKKWSGFSYDGLFLRIHLPKSMDAYFRASLIGLSILLSQRYIR